MLPAEQVQTTTPLARTDLDRSCQSNGDHLSSEPRDVLSSHWGDLKDQDLAIMERAWLGGLGWGKGGRERRWR